MCHASAHETVRGEMPAALPPDPVAVLREERALREQRRWAEAEAMLAAAVATWPNDESLLVDHGLLAHQQMHWEDMAARFTAVRERFPGHLFGYSRGGEALLWLGQAETAEAVIAAGLPHFPDNAELRVQWVLAACGRQDWAEAQRRAEQMLALLPDVADSYRFASEVKLRQGRHLEAEAMIGEGLQRLGPVPTLSRRFAELAALRGDWAAAARRWATAVKQAPDDADARRQLAEAVASRAPAAPEPAAAPPVAAPPVAAAPVATVAAPGAVPQDVKKLLLGFEPLGADCEFGLVQRHFGLEPLGLLRYASITLDSLIAALNDDLAGIGDPAFTRVGLGPGREFFIDDTRYGLAIHTHTGPDQTSAELLLPGAQRRMAFLARKLLEDLREPTKVFLRTADPAEPPARLLALHRALLRHGGATLLAVELSADPARIGRAEWLAPGVMRGWIERFGTVEPLFAQWEAMCRAAYALWAGGPPPAPATTTTLVQPIAFAPTVSFGSGPTRLGADD